MDKIQVMRLVYESRLDKYEKLFLLDFIMNESEESIPFVLDEFKLSSISKALKSGYKRGKEVGKDIGKKISKKASDVYYSSGAKVMHHPVWSRLAQYPPAIVDISPGAAFKYPRVSSDISKGVSWAKQKFAKGT
jgi:hypothetical protein